MFTLATSQSGQVLGGDSASLSVLTHNSLCAIVVVPGAQLSEVTTPPLGLAHAEHHIIVMYHQCVKDCSFCVFLEVPERAWTRPRCPTALESVSLESY